MLFIIAIGASGTSAKAQSFDIPPDFDPTDIPLFVMERLGVDFEAEGINVEDMREFFRERIAERIASGGASIGLPNSLFGDPRVSDSSKPRLTAMSTILDRFRTNLEVEDNDEWRVVKKRIEAILKAKRAASAYEMEMMPVMIGGGNMSGIRARFTSHQSTNERAVLKKVIDSNADPDELKRALEVYTKTRIRNLKKLEKTQDSLREILTLRQEVLATLIGLL